MNKLLLCILLCFSAIGGKAQSYFTSTEMGISGGLSQYFGDLNDQYGIKTANWAAGLYARKHLNNYISLKLGAYYTQVSYSDKLNSDLFQRQRNLDFTSDIKELSFQAEFNFFRFVTGDKYHRFTPYLTGGLGVFNYSPYTTYNGQRYFLRALGTEGQNRDEFKDRKYGEFAACVPIGVGIKYWVVGGVNLTLELTDRLTLTDYLDDVSATYVGPDKFPAPNRSVAYHLQDRSTEISGTERLGYKGKQRGNSATKDQYMMLLFSVSWHFTTYRCPNFMDKDLISTY